MYYLMKGFSLWFYISFINRKRIQDFEILDLIKLEKWFNKYMRIDNYWYKIHA